MTRKLYRCCGHYRLATMAGGLMRLATSVLTHREGIISLLSIGDRVEFKEQYEGRGLRARKVKFTLRFTGSFQDNARPSQTGARRITAKPGPRNGNAQGDHATKQDTL